MPSNLTFSFHNDRPIYLQLVEQLTSHIISGKLPPGARLPSVRDLAQIAEVNPNTMQRALTELEEQHLIYTERTNGKFVSRDEAQIFHSRREFARTKIRTFLDDMSDLGFSERDIIAILNIMERNQ